MATYFNIPQAMETMTKHISKSSIFEDMEFTFTSHEIIISEEGSERIKIEPDDDYEDRLIINFFSEGAYCVSFLHDWEFKLFSDLYNDLVKCLI